jgi:hypothetical protein
MQAADEPIACTLPSAALAERLTWIQNVTKKSLLAHRQDGSTLHLIYKDDALQELERIVALEQQCCGFLRFDLQTTPNGVELTISAIAGAASDAVWLFGQFAPKVDGVKARGCSPGSCG